jgi:hypothetical protein
LFEKDKLRPLFPFFFFSFFFFWGKLEGGSFPQIKQLSSPKLSLNCLRKINEGMFCVLEHFYIRLIKGYFSSSSVINLGEKSRVDILAKQKKKI